MANGVTPTLIMPRTERSSMRMGVFKGKLVLEFDKPVNYLELSRDEALEWLKALVNGVNDLTRQTGDGRLIGPQPEKLQ